MPLYEYQCKKCGHRFELIQSFSAEDAKECPVCQGEVERLISTPARAAFQGLGFLLHGLRCQAGRFRQVAGWQEASCLGRQLRFFG